MISDEADEVIKKLFESLKNRHQNNSQSMRGSESVFDYVQLLYYRCHKINVNRGGSYVDSPDWIKNKKATINPIIKKDNKCFQYAMKVGLNYKEIGKHAAKITKIKQYNWDRINFPSKKDDWKKFEKNNVRNSNREKQVILLMISNGEKWHYLTVKKLSALLR